MMETVARLARSNSTLFKDLHARKLMRQKTTILCSMTCMRT